MSHAQTIAAITSEVIAAISQRTETVNEAEPGREASVAAYAEWRRREEGFLFGAGLLICAMLRDEAH